MNSETLNRYLEQSRKAQLKAIKKGDVSMLKVHQGFHQTIKRCIENPDVLSYLNLFPILACYVIADFFVVHNITIGDKKIAYNYSKNGIKNNIKFALNLFQSKLSFLKVIWSIDKFVIHKIKIVRTITNETIHFIAIKIPLIAQVIHNIMVKIPVLYYKIFSGKAEIVIHKLDIPKHTTKVFAIVEEFKASITNIPVAFKMIDFSKLKMQVALELIKSNILNIPVILDTIKTTIFNIPVILNSIASSIINMNIVNKTIANAEFHISVVRSFISASLFNLPIIQKVIDSAKLNILNLYKFIPSATLRANFNTFTPIRSDIRVLILDRGTDEEYIYIDFLSEIPVNEDDEVLFEELVDLDNTDIQYLYKNQLNKRFDIEDKFGYTVLLVPYNYLQPQRYTLNPDDIGDRDNGKITDLFMIYTNQVLDEIHYNIYISKEQISIKKDIEFEFGEYYVEPLKPIITDIRYL